MSPSSPGRKGGYKDGIRLRSCPNWESNRPGRYQDYTWHGYRPAKERQGLRGQSALQTPHFIYSPGKDASHCRYARYVTYCSDSVWYASKAASQVTIMLLGKNSSQPDLSSARIAARFASSILRGSL